MSNAKEQTQQPWWNRPLWGDKSMLETIQQSIQHKHDTIPQEVIDHHNMVMAEARILAPIAKALDNVKFKSSEFGLFLKIQSYFAQGIGDYQGLANTVALFRVAIEAKNSFLKVEQIELFYRSTKQQDFYQFVFENLGKNLTTKEFQEKIDKKIEEILPGIKTEEGKNALTTYAEAVKSLARQDELGLKLLYLFKKFEMKDFSILRVMSDIVAYLQTRNLADFNDLVLLVKANEQKFRELGRIIEIPHGKDTYEDYARMLQYVALRQRHQASFIQFQRLVEVLEQWKNFYEIILGIRQQYPPQEFTQPKEFTTPILGEDIYLSYQEYFTKKRKT